MSTQAEAIGFLEVTNKSAWKQRKHQNRPWRFSLSFVHSIMFGQANVMAEFRKDGWECPHPYSLQVENTKKQNKFQAEPKFDQKFIILWYSRPNELFPYVCAFAWWVKVSTQVHLGLETDKPRHSGRRTVWSLHQMSLNKSESGKMFCMLSKKYLIFMNEQLLNAKAIRYFVSDLLSMTKAGFVYFTLFIARLEPHLILLFWLTGNMNAGPGEGKSVLQLLTRSQRRHPLSFRGMIPRKKSEILDSTLKSTHLKPWNLHPGRS